MVNNALTQNEDKNGIKSLDEIISNKLTISYPSFSSIQDKIDKKKQSIVPTYCAGSKFYFLNPAIVYSLTGNRDKDLEFISKEIYYPFKEMIEKNNVASFKASVELALADYNLLKVLGEDLGDLITLKSTIPPETNGTKKGIINKYWGKLEVQDNPDTTKVDFGDSKTEKNVVLNVIYGQKIERYIKNKDLDKVLNYLIRIDNALKSRLKPLPINDIGRAIEYFQIIQKNKSETYLDQKDNSRVTLNKSKAAEKLKKYKEDINSFINSFENEEGSNPDLWGTIYDLNQILISGNEKLDLKIDGLSSNKNKLEYFILKKDPFYMNAKGIINDLFDLMRIVSPKDSKTEDYFKEMEKLKDNGELYIALQKIIDDGYLNLNDVANSVKESNAFLRISSDIDLALESLSNNLAKRGKKQKHNSIKKYYFEKEQNINSIILFVCPETFFKEWPSISN